MLVSKNRPGRQLAEFAWRETLQVCLQMHTSSASSIVCGSCTDQGVRCKCPSNAVIHRAPVRILNGFLQHSSGTRNLSTHPPESGKQYNWHTTQLSIRNLIHVFGHAWSITKWLGVSGPCHSLASVPLKRWDPPVKVKRRCPGLPNTSAPCLSLTSPDLTYVASLRHQH